MVQQRGDEKVGRRLARQRRRRKRRGRRLENCFFREGETSARKCSKRSRGRTKAQFVPQPRDEMTGSSRRVEWRHLRSKGPKEFMAEFTRRATRSGGSTLRNSSIYLEVSLLSSSDSSCSALYFGAQHSAKRTVQADSEPAESEELQGAREPS